MFGLSFTYIPELILKQIGKNHYTLLGWISHTFAECNFKCRDEQSFPPVQQKILWQHSNFVSGNMPEILAFSFSLVTLKFSIQNFLKTKVLLKTFDTEFANKRSLIYSQPFCMCNTICLFVYIFQAAVKM